MDEGITSGNKYDLTDKIIDLKNEKQNIPQGSRQNKLVPTEWEGVCNKALTFS